MDFQDLGVSGGEVLLDNVDAVKASGIIKLAEGVKAAGLVDTLRSPDPFTVFAPTSSLNSSPESICKY